MTNFYICLMGDGTWQIHRGDCADVVRGIRLRKFNAAEKATAVDAMALIVEELGTAEDESTLRGMGYSENDFRIMPCCDTTSPGSTQAVEAKRAVAPGEAS